MAHFYGTVGQASPTTARTETTRTGTKKSGLVTYAAGHNGAIRVEVWHDADIGQDRYIIQQTTWQGEGVAQNIGSGVIGQKSTRKVQA